MRLIGEMLVLHVDAGEVQRLGESPAVIPEWIPLSRDQQ